jgi:replicative DNA helicase
MSINLRILESQEIELPEYQQEWINTVRHVENYTRNPHNGLDFGFPQMTKNFFGLNSGIWLIAGSPNVGKSAFALQLAWNVSVLNKNTYVLYFSLDDRVEDIVPRIVAFDQRIPISAVKFPDMYEGQTNVLARRIKGFSNLEKAAPRFKIRGKTHGSTIEYIRQSIEEHKLWLPEDYRLVIFVDNFYDIKSNNKNLQGSDLYNTVSDTLGELADLYDLPIVCTAELRKLNGYRRPTPDDLRDTVVLQYRADAILLCYNDVGVKMQMADVFWYKEGSEKKQPILEIHVGKNKISDFKGRLFYQFWADQSFLTEVPEEGANRYNRVITI